MAFVAITNIFLQVLIHTETSMFCIDQLNSEVPLYYKGKHPKQKQINKLYASTNRLYIHYSIKLLYKAIFYICSYLILAGFALIIFVLLILM